MPLPSPSRPGDISSLIYPVLTRQGWDLRAEWPAFASGVYQVYVDGRLAWSGTATHCLLPWPSSRVQVEVLAVPAAEAGTGYTGADYGADLPATDYGKPVLTWKGGASVAGYRVYRSEAAGGAVDYSAPVADVPYSDDGGDRTGYGIGGYGEGGYGTAVPRYTWTGPVLAAGDWSFGVAAYDAAGNEVSSPSEVTITLGTRPRPPAADDAGRRLTLSYNAATRVPTLSWLASPDA